MSWPYTLLAIVAALVVLGLLVGMVVGKNIRRHMEPDAPLPLDEFLACRDVAAIDRTYDLLGEWENALLDDESPEVSSVIIARRVITDLRDMKAAL